MSEIFHHLQGADKHLFLALQDFNYLGLGLHTVSSGTDVYQNPVTIEGVHRVALGDHDGVSVVASRVDAVLAITATNEDALGHRRAVDRLETASTHLGEEAVDRQLLQDLDDESAPLGCIGTHGSRHLLVIE